MIPRRPTLPTAFLASSPKAVRCISEWKDQFTALPRHWQTRMSSLGKNALLTHAGPRNTLRCHQLSLITCRPLQILTSLRKFASMGSPRRLEKQTQGKRVCGVGGGMLMAPVTYEVRNSWRGSSGGSLHARQMVLLCRQVNQAHLRGAWAGSRKPQEVDLELTFLLKKKF